MVKTAADFALGVELMFSNNVFSFETTKRFLESLERQGVDLSSYRGKEESSINLSGYAVLARYGDGSIAEKSCLHNMVVSDGNVFNPYIHRTYMPLQVLNFIVAIGAVKEIWGNLISFDDNEGGKKSNQQIYDMFLIKKLSGYGAKPNEYSIRKSKYAAGKIFSRSQMALNGEVAYRNSMNQESDIVMRIVSKTLKSLKGFIDNESRILDLCGEETKMVEDRIGLTLDDVNYCMEIGKQNKDMPLINCQWYALYRWVGVFGTIKSIRLFPKRYDAELKNSARFGKPFSAYFDLDERKYSDAGKTLYEKSELALADLIACYKNFISNEVESIYDETPIFGV